MCGFGSEFGLKVLVWESQVHNGLLREDKSTKNCEIKGGRHSIYDKT
jgi:hypothetical protein